MNRTLNAKGNLKFILIPPLIYFLFSILMLLLQRLYGIGLSLLSVAVFSTFNIYCSFLFKKTNNMLLPQVVLWILSFFILMLFLIFDKDNILGFGTILMHFIHSFITSYCTLFILKRQKQDQKMDVMTIFTNHYIVLNLLCSVIFVTPYAWFLTAPPVAIFYCIYLVTLVTDSFKEFKPLKKVFYGCFMSLFFFFLSTALYCIIPYQKALLPYIRLVGIAFTILCFVILSTSAIIKFIITRIKKSLIRWKTKAIKQQVFNLNMIKPKYSPHTIHFHGKVPHRTDVMKQIAEYLGE